MRKKSYMRAAVYALMAMSAFTITACGKASDETAEAASEETSEEITDAARESKDETDEIIDVARESVTETEEILDVARANQTSGADSSTSADGKLRVEPLPNTVTEETMKNGRFAASFDPSKIRYEGDVYYIDVTSYYYELFDMVDMSRLKAGDTIVIDGSDVLIDSIENDSGRYVINGGIDMGGYELATNDDTVYYEIGYDDILTYHKAAELTMPVGDSCLIHDDSVPGEQEKLLGIEDIVNNAADYNEYSFIPNNTEITADNGIITKMRISYMP